MACTPACFPAEANATRGHASAPRLGFVCAGLQPKLSLARTLCLQIAALLAVQTTLAFAKVKNIQLGGRKRVVGSSDFKKHVNTQVRFKLH